MKKSIKRLPKRTQEELTVLLDLVCKNIENCQMVILFGSYARGNYVYGTVISNLVFILPIRVITIFLSFVDRTD